VSFAKPDTFQTKNGSCESRIYFTAKLLSYNLFRRVKRERERERERERVIKIIARTKLGCHVGCMFCRYKFEICHVVAVVVVVSKVTE